MTKWKKILKAYNGWLGFAVGTALFFAVPPLYRLIDPTAGAFDAGYIHPIIYAFVVVSFASGFAWLTLHLTAPGLHRQFDKFLECTDTFHATDAVKLSFALYFFYMASIIAVICFVL